MKEKNRTIIISDIHGCYLEFIELLNTLQYNSNTDRVILGGDLIDRGPDSVSVVKKSRELNLECVMGNHEYKFLRWFKGNKHFTPQKHYTQFSDADITYINNMPYYLKLDDNSWIIHGGARSNLPIDKQSKEDLLYLRYMDKDGNTVPLRKAFKNNFEGAIFWTNFWNGSCNIVYGHNVHSLETIKIDTFNTGNACYGIDTGCCFGGHLSALIWETKEVIQVKGKETYCKLGFE